MKCDIQMEGRFDKEFKEIRDLLKIDIKHFKNIANSKSGHLGDIIGGLKTITQSMDLKIEKLKLIFEEQKKSIGVGYDEEK